ncbi:MAG TPA: hypothetical protein VFS25_10855 [Chitinophaga sp.]|uniref:hypothetical protein n=1 Tax=Chitinophaga sp. TaxID=1869181 RepID=UPI002DBEA924|nr:hypothetical protein [Chitinophaga sp.]HEU4553327.1 hypothetical protein [Chitinophaga sp.]
MKNFCFNRIFAAVVILIAVATIFFACSKNNEATPTTDQNDNQAIAAAAYEAQASTLYDDLFDVALAVGDEQGLASDARKAPHGPGSFKLGSGYTVTIDNVIPGVFPKTITLDFGSGCTGTDGRVRAGKMNIVISGYIMMPGTKITITLDGYSVSEIGLAGTKVIENKSAGNVFKYSTSVTDGRITLDTLTFGYTCEKEITQVEGGNTPFYTEDDAYSGTGTASLTYPGGTIVTYTTKEPLVKALKCAWIGKGKADVTFDQVTATIDYGAGICDDSATISIGDKVKGVILPR